MLRDFHLSAFNFLYHEGFFRKLTNACGYELIRAVYPAVRDRNWGTVHFIITDEQNSVNNNYILIKLKIRYQQKEIDFSASFEISASDNGHFDFTFEGYAETDFLKNRIGLNLLLPIEGLTACECLISHSGKKQSRGIFPDKIAPHQPFMDITGLNWTDANGNEIYVNFEGDTFEMEDQRNWTDASFKVYSTPLSKPFPALIKKGSHVSQKISIRLITQKTNIPKTHANSMPFPEQVSFSLPAIGIGASGEKEVLSENEAGILSGMGMDYCSFLCDLGDARWLHHIQAHLGNCAILKVKAKAGFIVPSTFYQQDQLMDLLSKHPEDFTSVEFFNRGGFTSEGERIASLYKTLKQKTNINAGSGTYAYYAELNRSKTLTDSMDYVTYSASPQVHGFDNLTLIENLKGLGDTIRDAKLKFNLPVDINALTLRQRMNFVSTDKIPLNDNSSGISDTIDIRQHEVFNALWTLGAIKSLMFSGARSVSLFETVGRCGVIQSEDPLTNASVFSELPLAKYPVFKVLKELLRFKDAYFYALDFPSGEYADGFEIRKDQKREIWLWKYVEETQRLDMSNISEPKKMEMFNFESGEWNETKLTTLGFQQAFKLNVYLFRMHF